MKLSKLAEKKLLECRKKDKEYYAIWDNEKAGLRELKETLAGVEAALPKYQELNKIGLHEKEYQELLKKQEGLEKDISDKIRSQKDITREHSKNTRNLRKLRDLTLSLQYMEAVGKLSDLYEKAIVDGKPPSPAIVEKMVKKMDKDGLFNYALDSKGYALEITKTIGLIIPDEPAPAAPKVDKNSQEA